MTRFRQLQDQIDCTNLWLADMLGVTPVQISRMRSGKRPMSRATELAMLALASGWRP